MTPNKLQKRLNRAMSRSKKNMEPSDKMFERMRSIMIQYGQDRINELQRSVEEKEQRLKNESEKA